MRRQISLVLTLAAWLLATGSHWDLVQTFAWGRMIATYSHTMPVLSAVEKTFTGNELCGVCELVQGATQSDNAAKVPGAKAPEKIVCVNPAGVLVCGSPATHCLGLVSDPSAPSSAERSTPPGPPPRFAA